MTASRGSISTRLLVTVLLLLVLTFALTTALLDAIFRQTSENAVADLLELQVLALIGVAEPGGNGSLVMPSQLPEPRLARLGSGLYAEIVDPVGQRVWRSPSAMGVGLARGLSVDPGQRIIEQRRLADGTNVMVLGAGIVWELVGDVSYGFQVFVAEDLTAYDRQLATFRRQLMIWFAAVAAGLLLAIGILLRWGLKPLRRMAREIRNIESGDAELLGEDYPQELSGVARNMNTLINYERQRISRFRTTMDDLAHSLKTPLAVLRNEIENREPDTDALRDQVTRMQGVVDYQLRRAAATGPRSLSPAPIRIAPIVREVASSLRKIHQDKDVTFEFSEAEPMSYAAEQGDLYELFGNLIDNAWKWCRSSVHVNVTKDDAGQLIIIVEDDGPGVSQADTEAILSRGNRGRARGDVPGQGIGLAVVAELIELYRGQINIDRGAAGGAQVRVVLPA